MNQQPALWLIWSFEHKNYWPQDRRGYVPLRLAGCFTFEEAVEIVTQANRGMSDGLPEEAMLPLPHPAILAQAEG